jgi:autophagy-related protein 16
LTTSRDNTLKLVDTRTYDVIQTFTSPQFKVGLNWSKSCFSPDGVHVASGSADGSLCIWNVVSGNEVKVIKAHKSAVVGVVWAPKGNTLYSAERDQTVCIYGSPSSIDF